MTEPRILTFSCTWCSYGGADHAGGLRLEQAPGVRLVRVMCSGRVDPQMVLSGFRAGADAVVILGCHPGECHYKVGNVHAAKRAALLAPMLAQHGIEPERFRLDWVSASEGERFARIMEEMNQRLTTLGPLRLAPRRPLERST